MKLYFSPGACSLASHITLLEAELPFTADKVDMRTRQTSDGKDFTTVNPNGYVPALELDNGEVLCEGQAILQYLADQKPGAQLAPPPGTLPRYRLIEWLSFISSELHKGFGPLLRPGGAGGRQGCCPGQAGPAPQLCRQPPRQPPVPGG